MSIIMNYEKIIDFSRMLADILLNSSGFEQAHCSTKEVEAMRYLGKRVVQPADLQVGKWDLRSEAEKKPDRKLLQSIEVHGILKPLFVQRERDDKLLLVDGHRRYRAAQKLGLEQVEVFVIEGPDSELAKFVAVINNMHRPHTGLTQARLARLYHNLGMSLEEIGALIGKCKGYVSDLIHILELGSQVRGALENKQITISHARLLLRVEAAKREAILQAIIERGLSVKQTKTLIRTGQTVIGLRELGGSLPPGVTLRDEDDHISVIFPFGSIDEFRSQLWAVLRVLQGVEDIELNSRKTEKSRPKAFTPGFQLISSYSL